MAFRGILGQWPVGREPSAKAGPHGWSRASPGRVNIWRLRSPGFASSIDSALNGMFALSGPLLRLQGLGTQRAVWGLRGSELLHLTTPHHSLLEDP